MRTAGFLVTLSLLLVSALVADDFSGAAHKLQAETCEDVLDVVGDFSDCHDNFPTGCTHSTRPGYDAYLNYLKNQVVSPTPPQGDRLSADGFAVLEENLPPTLGTRNHADHAVELAQAGEGQVREVVGFLYYFENTGKPRRHQTNGETSNCQLLGTANSDFHLGIGFDPNMASRIRSGTVKHVIGAPPAEAEQTSIIGEMTPHMRAELHPGWTLARLNRAVGRQILVRGQLVVDNDHVNAKDDCGNPNANTDACWRASVWEIHPITEFFVCTGTQPCDPNDLSTWKRLENL
ncbi:MAG TPA: hypothetical protein VGA84_13415 [Thermoanaerobaculia bacterium]